MHKGGADSGHYFVLIKDFERGIWRKYNDELVTEVHNLDDIFGKDHADRPTNAAFAVYIKEELVHDLVQSVCRNPTVEEAEAASPRPNNQFRPSFEDGPPMEVDEDMMDTDDGKISTKRGSVNGKDERANVV